MADFNKLKDTIRGAIYPNGRGAISADKHQAALLDMADTMQETDTKLTELSAENASIYYEKGNVGGDEETPNDYTSRSCYIPVNKGDVITAAFFRIKLYDKNKLYYAEDLTHIQLSDVKSIDYTITDDECKYIRIVSAQGLESPILINGKNYLPYLLPGSSFDGLFGKMYPLKALTLEQYYNYPYPVSVSLSRREKMQNAILGVWVKNPQVGATYHLTQFRHKQISSDWDNTEYSSIRIAKKTSSVDDEVILEDRTSSTIKEGVQVFETSNYIVVVDWSKAEKGFGYADVADEFNQMDDVVFEKNNTSYLTMIDAMPETEPSARVSIVADGNSFSQDANGVINMPMASNGSLGLMSSADKRKLDALQQGNINIEGSGIAKNASAYGFLPTNDGLTNAINLQRCCEGGGTILIDLVGSYNLSRSILVDSNTSIIFGQGVIISLTQQDGVAPTYPFINRGALTDERNENISIEGLHIKTNGIQGNDITALYGQRGYVAMKGIKNLSLKGITILDVPTGWYTIHIQQFENINLENIHIEGMKDGIHLGVGKKFRIAHCIFKTNDDSIALNAHDYPSGTSEFGWIEDGIIEDITILPTPTGNTSRGIYCLGGAWTDWKSGNLYQPLGEACVSENGVYVTCGARSYTKIASTQRPNHQKGIQTYSDGLTWIKLDNKTAQYDAGVRNITIRDIHIASKGRIMTFNLDQDDYSNSLYEGCAAPSFDNVTLENVRQDEYAEECVISMYTPFTNLRIINCDIKVGFRGIAIEKVSHDTYSGKCSMLIIGMSLYQTSEIFVKNDRGQCNLDLKLVGTMVNYNSTALPTIYGSANVNVISDIELNKA